MYTLPSPRLDYYQHNSYQTIQKKVLKETNELSFALGYYQLNQREYLLKEMQVSENNILFIGLIFDIVLVMFIIVAVLLIYSLLMISVETKTHEIGIMRLVGLTKFGFIGMIFTQSACFVLPALFSGFLCSLPCIWFIYSFIFGDENGK